MNKPTPPRELDAVVDKVFAYRPKPKSAPAKLLGYAIEVEDFELLRDILKALHGDGSVLTSDKRRDLANLMSVVLTRVESNEWRAASDQSSFIAVVLLFGFVVGVHRVR